MPHTLPHLFPGHPNTGLRKGRLRFHVQVRLMAAQVEDEQVAFWKMPGEGVSVHQSTPSISPYMARCGEAGLGEEGSAIQGIPSEKRRGRAGWGKGPHSPESAQTRAVQARLWEPCERGELP